MMSIKQISDLVEITAQMLGLQYGIIDTNGIAIVGTGEYKKKIGTKRPHGCHFVQTLKTQQSYAVKNPTVQSSCQDCEALRKCPYSVVLCSPIINGTETIGAIGLLGYDWRSNDMVFKDQDRWNEYTKEMAYWLSKFSAVSEILELRKRSDTDLTKLFRLNKTDSLIIADSDFRIVALTNSAKEILCYNDEGNDFNQSLTKFINFNFSEGLSDRHEKDLDFTLWQNDKLLNFELLNVRKFGLSSVQAVVIKESGSTKNKMEETIYTKNQALDKIIGNSKPVREMKDLIKKIAPRWMPVLIEGESGTGKELVAEAIHACSIRSQKSLVSINCSAIPEALFESELFGYDAGSFTGAARGGRKGKIEIADGGILFLDEVGEMSLAIQAKFLRVLDKMTFYRVGGTKPVSVNVRIICATNANLEKLVREGKFREDLYYRLNVLPIKLAPLREKVEDIPLLVEFFIDMYNKQNLSACDVRITPAALQTISEYNWPGNIRQLRNMIEYLLIIVKENVIDENTLPSYLTQRVDDIKATKPPWSKPDQEDVAKALTIFGTDTNGKKKAAGHLGISLASLYRIIKK